MTEQPAQQPGTNRAGLLLRGGLLLGTVIVAVLGLYFYGDKVMPALAARETQLHSFVSERPLESFAIAFVIYILVTGLSLPGAAALTVLYGWLFRFWPGVIVVSFASTSGATIAFLLSRYLFGRAIQTRYGERLTAFNAAMEREGAFYLFTLRLIPQVPFFVINAVMGLTKLRTRTFWWVSQLGMLPGTCVYVLAGANAPTLQRIADEGLASILDWKWMLALILLGVLPLALKWLLGRRAASLAGGPVGRR